MDQPTREKEQAMRTATATALAVTPLAAALVGCGGSTQWPPRYHQTRAMVLTPPGEEVSVTTSSPFGDLDLAAHGRPAPAWKDLGLGLPEAGPDEVALVAVLRSDREDRLGDAVVSPEWSGGTLRLRVEWPSGKRDNEGVDWVVRVPTVGGVSGEYNFGDVRVFEPHGPVDLDSDFGDVWVEDAHAAVVIESDFGDVAVTLTDENPGPVTIESNFGDVSVEAGRAFTGDLELDTDFGDSTLIQAGLYGGERSVRGSSRVKSTLGTGPRSRISADFGDVEVRVRE